MAAIVSLLIHIAIEVHYNILLCVISQWKLMLEISLVFAYILKVIALCSGL